MKRRALPGHLAAGALCVVVLASGGCQWLARRYWLAKYDREAANATRGYERATTDGERASRLAERGRAYSDKGRYSRFAKSIRLSDYEQLFAQAMQDHNRAVGMAPHQADVYVMRGWSFYDRATVLRLDTFENPNDDATWFRRAQADFTSAIERDPKNVTAWDMRALVRAALGDRDGVIVDRMASAKLNPSGTSRLADAYCERGGFRLQQKQLTAAVTDYEEAIALGGTADGCSCEPYAPLAYVYIDELHDYDKSWKLVRRARSTNHWLPPELVAKLSQASGRTE